MNTIQRINRTVSWALLIALLMAVPAVSAGEPRHDQRALHQIEVKKGICVVLGDPRCERALGLAKGSELMLYVQVRNEEDRQAACRAADAAGLYGTRIYVGNGDPARIGLADNYADAVVATGDATNVARAQALRVLRPGGKALLDREVLTKPLPDGSDDWSHHYHGPDIIRTKTTQLVRAPYLTQFVAEPALCTGASKRCCLGKAGSSWPSATWPGSSVRSPGSRRSWPSTASTARCSGSGNSPRGSWSIAAR